MARLGERIGPFELVQRLDQGSGLELWRARRADDNASAEQTVWVRLVADLADVEAARGLRQEYEALRRIEDPRVPAVLAYFAGQGALAVQWSEGVLLDQVIEAARAGEVVLSPATALDITLEVAHALRSAHSLLREGGERIVHGGLCPHLVMLTVQGQVRLLGLGARHTDLEARYAPPERAEGRTVGIEGDQWQLGALLVELLTLEPLLDGGAGRPGQIDRRLSELEREQPAAARVLRRALSASPDDRYRAERELLKALHGVAREQPGSSIRHELALKVLPFLEPAPEQPRTPEEPAPPRKLRPDVVAELMPDPPTDEVLVPLRPPPLEPAPLPTLVPPSETRAPTDLGPEELTEPLPAPRRDQPSSPARKPMVGEWTAGLALLLFVLAIFYYAWQKL
jgi:hypothetical protein